MPKRATTNKTGGFQDGQRRSNIGDGELNTVHSQPVAKFVLTAAATTARLIQSLQEWSLGTELSWFEPGKTLYRGRFWRARNL